MRLWVSHVSRSPRSGLNTLSEDVKNKSVNSAPPAGQVRVTLSDFLQTRDSQMGKGGAENQSSESLPMGSFLSIAPAATAVPMVLIHAAYAEPVLPKVLRADYCCSKFLGRKTVARGS